MLRLCPVCRQEVTYTRLRRNIASHLDRAGRDDCPMSGHPYELAVEQMKGIR